MLLWLTPGRLVSPRGSVPTVSTLLSCAGCVSPSCYHAVFDVGLNADTAAAWRVALSRLFFLIVVFFFFFLCSE